MKVHQDTVLHLPGWHRSKSLIKYGVWLRVWGKKHSYVAREGIPGNLTRLIKLYILTFLSPVIPLLGLYLTDKHIFGN